MHTLVRCLYEVSRNHRERSLGRGGAGLHNVQPRSQGCTGATALAGLHRCNRARRAALGATALAGLQAETKCRDSTLARLQSMRPCAAFRILAALLVGRSYALRVRQPPTLSRRAFTAAAGASLLCLRPLESTASGAVAGSDQQSRLVWEPRSEMPRRAGSTRYRKAFVAYLARFLLNFDSGSAEWWADQANL